jgi:hypothetical protein
MEMATINSGPISVWTRCFFGEKLKVLGENRNRLKQTENGNAVTRENMETEPESLRAEP